MLASSASIVVVGFNVVVVDVVVDVVVVVGSVVETTFDPLSSFNSFLALWA